MERYIDRSMRLVYDLHEITLPDTRKTDDINKMLNMIDTFCRDVALHCKRVSDYSILLGKRLELSSMDMGLLWCAALLHDIGKIKIPKEILNKPAKLTKEEYEIVKTHSLIGYEIINRNENMEDLAEIILYHHERIDGRGYPSCMEGFDIPLLSRIIAVADSFDAMTTKRPYRMALSTNEAVDELKRGRQTQFDRYIVDCFIDMLENSRIKPKECNIALGLY